MRPVRALALPAFEKEKGNENTHEKHGAATVGRLRRMKLLPCAPCFVGMMDEWCGVTVTLRAVSMSTGVTVQVASLTIYRRVLDLEIGTAGGYCPHIFGFWRPVHCLSATAVLYWKIVSVLPFKDTETALPLYTLSQGYITCCCAPRP